MRFALVLLALWVLVSCSETGKNGASQKGGGGNRPVAVSIAKAVKKDFPVQIRDVGAVEAYATVQVKSQVDGTILKKYFTAGDDIKQDQILFTIDPRPFQAELRQAEANYAKNLVTARNAKLSAARAQTLQQKGAVALEEMQGSRTLADAAAAAADSDKAAVESAQLKLSFTTITAPMAGRTGDVTIDVGNLVKSNTDPLVTIRQLQPIYVKFSVPESNLQDIREYSSKGPLEVEVEIPGPQPKTLKGQLTFINNEVDKAAGTVLLKATFRNERLLLWPGQFVDAALTVTTLKDMVVIPSSAVQTGQEGPYLFVMKPDKSVEMRYVTTGMKHQQEIVIEKGVAAGETVVTDGQLRLTNGTKVEPTTPVDRNEAVTSGSSPRRQKSR